MLDASPILAQAAHEGFELAGICDAAPPESLEAYEAWLGKGYHASMEYLARHLDAKRDPASLLPGVQSILAVGLMYRTPEVHRPGQARVAQYAQGRDYHKVLSNKLKRIAAWMAEAYPNVRTRACVDAMPILEREYAMRAGLGWFGKNTMLIDSRRGSWFVIGLLLMTERFAPAKAAVGGCGSCRACIDACPTGAIVHEEGRWQVNAGRCISYLTIEHDGPIHPELAARMGDWTFGCDVCQDVCPFNQPRESQPDRAPLAREPDFVQVRDWPTLDAIEAMDLETWDRLTRGTPVRRAGFDGLKRNTAINRANLARERA